jgi:hypothetical protein
MSLVPIIHRDGDRLVELFVDPRAWVPEALDPEPGLSLRAATRLRRQLSSAEVTECACPTDCLRDHPNE